MLFVSEEDGAPAAWVTDLGSPDARQLAGVSGATFPAAADPLKTHALVVAITDDQRDHREALWLVPLDGGEAVPLAPAAGRIRNPAWAPDGGAIVFESDGASFRDLYRVKRNGTGLKRLTNTEKGTFEPSFSPDGARVVFASSRDGNAEVYTMAADGTGTVRLTDAIAEDTRPQFLPVSGSIAWISDRDGAPRVWRMSSDGSDPALLRTRLDGIDIDHSWSPDGRTVAVVGGPSPRELGIEIVSADTGAIVARVDGAGPDEHPAWSPDGRWLAWTSSRDGEPAIWVCKADGSSPRKVVDRPGAQWLPRWVR